MHVWVLFYCFPIWEDSLGYNCVAGYKQGVASAAASAAAAAAKLLQSCPTLV